jgi:hypothetical protein
MSGDQKAPGWTKQRRPSSLRSLVGTLRELQGHLVKKSEETAKKADHLAKQALKNRG